MPKFLFVLGADDLEMSAIENLLTVCGLSYVYATVDGKRCHGGNAYRANGWIDSSSGHHGDSASGTQLVCVECSVTLRADRAPWTISIDHHRPGDPGYGGKPEHFWESSSLGQIIRFLGDRMLFPEGWLIPEDHYYIAAADHCLGHAYADRCPGIDSEKLLDYRVKQKAANQGVSEDIVRRHIKWASELLATLQEEKQLTVEPLVAGPSIDDIIYLSGWGHMLVEVAFDNLVGREIVGLTYQGCSLSTEWQGYGMEKTTVRFVAEIPELPEAACYLGKAYVTEVTELGGRRKLVLGGLASAKQVQDWMDLQKKLGKEVYGVPERGYAGAYVT